MGTDYKKTLNLPRTDFPMKADLVKREPGRLEKWRTEDLYGKIRKARAGRKTFILHDGPPFANGDVHIGTALNKILKDFIIKYQSLRGHSAPYVPGWDCHGLPIEFKVSQELRKKGEQDTDPVVIRQACEAYARKFIDVQRDQFKRLGVLGEWEKPYLTLNKEYEAAELRLFADIIDKGFVYRGKKPVYWSIPCRTALAEAEVEYKDHVSPSIYVKFPVVGQPGTYILIWTTTPWTLPANLAVAYNSTFSYSQVLVNGETYLLSTLLLDDVAAKAGWGGFEIMRSLQGSDLSGLEFQHPFCNRTGKFFAGDDFVTNDTGTGFVHIAPGHGQEDYQLGLKNGLPIYSPVDDQGRLALTNELPEEEQMPPELVGQSILEKQGRSEANEAVLELLKAKNALVHHEDYSHSYPHCWRSKTPVIFRAMNQWFIRIDHAPEGNKTFRQCAVEAIDGVSWIPDWGINRIKGAVESRPDWCISRQRTWGVPIPAFYDADHEPMLDSRIVRRVAGLVEQHGSNVWFEQNAAELWKLVRPDDWDGPEAVEKSQDTLDVWIDSGSSSRAVIARREELAQESTDTPFQADMYLEGSDQHRGWFQSSLLLSLAGNGAAPYRTVLTHGFMVRASKLAPGKKEKVSKSAQGTYEKPQTADVYVNDYGADVVRLWVASQDFRGDILVDQERIKKVGEMYRMIRNTLRYQLSNLYDFDPGLHSVPDEKLTPLDRWILWMFATLEKEVAEAFDRFEFHVVYQKISHFVAVELSAMYHDLVKDRLYTDPAGSHRRRSTQTVLHRLATRLCQLLSPLLAFTMDEAWEYLPGKQDASPHLSEWHPQAFEASEKEQRLWSVLFSLREAAMTPLEAARQQKMIGKSLEAGVSVQGKGQDFEVAQSEADLLRELLNVSQLSFKASDNESIEFHISRADGQKCERCWHLESDTNAHEGYPMLCGRCVEAVRSVESAST